MGWKWHCLGGVRMASEGVWMMSKGPLIICVEYKCHINRQNFNECQIPQLRLFSSSGLHSFIISSEGLILTLSIIPCPQGRIFWSTPCRKIDDERMSVLHQNSGGIGKSIPSALKISLYPWDFPRTSPPGNLSGLRKSLGRRGWISQYLPRFGGARIESKHVKGCLREHVHP